MNTKNSILDFLKKSTDAYHAVKAIKDRLLSEGYTELYENDTWQLKEGGKYFAVREGASIVAFNYFKDSCGFMISASHCDSPAFKLKPSLESVGAYTRLDVEKYGGMIHYSWLDRPLSVSGRVVVKSECGVKTALVNIDRDILIIPSVAIHLNPKINSGIELTPANDMLPLLTSKENSGAFISLIAEAAGVSTEDIISHDLYLYNRQAPAFAGAEGEYIISPRFDDLGCVYASLEGFLAADKSKAIPVLAVFDNEEVGSSTNHGAGSTFLSDVLLRISGEKYGTMLNNTFMLSIDVAHAKHPAHPELSDALNAPMLNGGVAIKYNANQRYTTDAVSAGLFRLMCEKAGICTQNFTARADMPCGSTLGTIANTSVSVLTVDVGLPLLSMHSSCETAGAYDVDSMTEAVKFFYSSAIKRSGDEVKLI